MFAVVKFIYRFQKLLIFPNEDSFIRFILLSLLLIPTIIGVIYSIYEFSNVPQDFISYDDF